MSQTPRAQGTELPFPPVEHVAGALDAGVLFICDHASNALPSRYGDLGVTAADFSRHIAYDIGAATITRRLAQVFQAPAVLTTYSRLLIDPNRGADDPTLVMRISDGALVPGNARIDAAEVAHRRAAYWQPYRDAVMQTLDAMIAAGPPPVVIAIHSFTHKWKEYVRPWHVGILWDADPRIALPLVAEIETSGDVVVGNNEPYDGALEGDTLTDCGTGRGLAHCLVEVRQDLIGDDESAARWGDRLAQWLRPVLALPDVHIIRHYGTRTRVAVSSFP